LGEPLVAKGNKEGHCVTKRKIKLQFDLDTHCRQNSIEHLNWDFFVIFVKI
jgi:hypothetical protein